MPQFIESALAKQAKKKGLMGEDADRYIYGALNNQGMMHGSKETPKGKAVQRKHDLASLAKAKKRKK